MLISVNWLRDFVDLPDDLDVPELAERFTMTCAEVEGVERIQVSARDLIAAQIVSLEELSGTRNLRQAVLDIGGERVDTVSAAPVLRIGECVVYAPPGACTAFTGEIHAAEVAGVLSQGMILNGAALGIAMAEDEAIFCPPSMSAGAVIDPAMLDDWIIEVDNKSITHRPDLWGHYGIAREVAAILRLPLKPYPVTPRQELADGSLPEIPIEIDDPRLCPRYSALRLSGVEVQSAPLWMQVRLGHVGMRPINCLVDLSNYIMAELGQPTHAFDGDKLERIEVARAAGGEVFQTLDGVERTLPEAALMIQSNRSSVALAGIMGGLETEVSEQTRSILLESANFEPAGIRRCAAALGLRTEASARFEKSLDPANTVLAIQRFVYLAREEFSKLHLTGRLSDCYPQPADDVHVEVDPDFVRRFMGHQVSNDEMTRILTAIDFDVAAEGDKLRIRVPSFRATKDISIEADIIEEIARYVGYDNIDSRLPDVTVRHFAPNSQHRIERDSLRAFCGGLGYSEIHQYIWYDDAWLRQIGYAPPAGVELRNPAAAGQHLLQHTLMPNLLAAVERNRLHADAFKLSEIASVYPGGEDSNAQRRHLGLVSAAYGKKAEDTLFARIKGDLETWGWQVLGLPLRYERAGGDLPRWAHEHKTAAVFVDAQPIGLVSVVPLELRRAMDEHLSNWGVAWAEIELDNLPAARAAVEQLRPVPEFPEVDLDFSILAPADMPFETVNEKLRAFHHELLRRITYVTAYEGKSVPAGKRSLTYRTRIGAADRTLVDAELAAFREAVAKHIAHSGFEQR